MIRPVLRAALASACLALAPAAARAQSCDEACLTGLANRYMDALVSHDPKGLPWAERVGYAENSTKLRIGEGSWVTIYGRTMTPLIVADAKTGRVVWAGTIDDHGQPGFYAMEMRVEGGKIAAVQAVIRRKEGRQPFGDPLTYAPDAAFAAPVAKGAQTSRSKMVSLVQGYFDSQLARDGKPRTSIGEGCRHIENGVAMTGNLPAAAGEDASCAAALERGLFGEYEAVRRRVVAVDEARGIVAVIGDRDLPAAEVSFLTRDGKPYAAEAKYPRSVGFVSLFRIEGGKIMRIETIANEIPYLMPFAWTE